MCTVFRHCSCAGDCVPLASTEEQGTVGAVGAFPTRRARPIEGSSGGSLGNVLSTGSEGERAAYVWSPWSTQRRRRMVSAHTQEPLATPHSNELAGLKVLVTGASRGIGKAIALDMALHGATVMCSSRDQSTLGLTVQEIIANGGVAESAMCDLSDPLSGRALVQETIARLGDLDVVVNNAGLGGAPGDALEEWLQVVAVNLTAPFVICETASEHFKQKRSGKIINISSILGVVADPGVPTPYVAAKHGLIGMSKNLAAKLAPFGVQVNVVAPGYVVTEMTKEDFEDERMHRSIVARTPLGRWGAESDITGIVTFLASDAAAFITGQTICVDGGWTCV